MNMYAHLIASIAIQNKYTKWYLSIVSNSKYKEGYCEKHHILPKCFKLGGEKDPANIVKLTAKEHFVCHLLLTKMFLDKKKFQMLYACNRMCFKQTIHHKRDYVVSSSVYAMVKSAHSQYMKTNNHNKDGSQSKAAWAVASEERHLNQSAVATKRNIEYWATRKKPVLDFICEVCGVEFSSNKENRKCCGSSCAAKWRNKMRWLGKQGMPPTPV
jgi:hypothetical protein